MFLSKSKLKLLLISSIFVTGCSWFSSDPGPVDIRTVPVQQSIYEPARPEGVSLVSPTWHVVTKKNMDDFWKRMEKRQGENPVFFAITPKDYEAMSYNIQEFRRVILEYMKIVDYYESLNEPRSKDKQSGNKLSGGKEAQN